MASASHPSASRLIARLHEARRLLTLTPFDAATPEGRSDERHRRALLSALASALGKVVAVVVTLITLPLTLHYLGPQRFGIWAVLTSFMTLLAFADLGLGNGLLSAIANAHGRKDRAAMQRQISSAVAVLAAIAALLLAVFTLVWPLIDWPGLFNVSEAAARREAGPALGAFVVCFALSLPFGAVERAQSGLQRGFLGTLWSSLGRIAGLAAILMVMWAGGGLAALVWAFMGSMLAASVLNSLIFFGRQERDIAPRPGAVSFGAARILGGVGLWFVAVQAVTAATIASDALIIARTLGASAVAAYAVPAQLFGLVTSVAIMLTGPLWPAYGEALAQGDEAWVRRTFRASLWISGGLAIATAGLLIPLTPWLMRVWIGQGASAAIAPSLGLLVALALWKVLEAPLRACAMLMQGLSGLGNNALKFQFAAALACALVAVPLKIALIPWLGVPGPVWATVIGLSLCVAAPTFLYLRKRL